MWIPRSLSGLPFRNEVVNTTIDGAGHLADEILLTYAKAVTARSLKRVRTAMVWMRPTHSLLNLRMQRYHFAEHMRTRIAVLTQVRQFGTDLHVTHAICSRPRWNMLNSSYVFLLLVLATKLWLLAALDVPAEHQPLLLACFASIAVGGAVLRFLALIAGCLAPYPLLELRLPAASPHLSVDMLGHSLVEDPGRVAQVLLEQLARLPDWPDIACMVIANLTLAIAAWLALRPPVLIAGLLLRGEAAAFVRSAPDKFEIDEADVFIRACRRELKNACERHGVRDV